MSSSPSTYREQDKCKSNLHFILVGTFRMTLPSFYHNFVTQKILVPAINRKTIYHNHTHGTQINLTFIHEKCILDIHVIMSYSGLLTWNTTFLCIQDIIMARQHGFWRPQKKNNPLKKCNSICRLLSGLPWHMTTN